MAIRTFDEIANLVKAATTTPRMVIAAAADTHTLEAALAARAGGLASIIAVGDQAKILEILAEAGETIPECDIYDESDGARACEKAVTLVREGRADFIMKGMIDTGVILKAVVNKETGLQRGGVMSHFAIFQTPGYHKLLTAVDGGMVTYPTLEQKKAIIENTVTTLHALGYERPNVGVLACVEKVNPKMPETVEAAELAAMNERGEITGCVVNGPISYDCAVSREIARIKGYGGAVAGEVDALIAPNIHAGNIMGKMLTVTCGAKMAGIIVGAKCPIILTSRGSTAEEKYLSIMLSAAISGGAARYKDKKVKNKT
jgi:phosphate butyryltransferase